MPALLLAALTATAVNAAPAEAATPPPATTSTKIAAGYVAKSFFYTDAQNADQSLTATYRSGRANAPWVVTIHGGGWFSGAQSEVQPAVAAFTKAGFQVFNLSYRLVGTGAGRVAWADQKLDVLTALAWIRRYASAFGIDPNRGALWGFSAGGHLATIAGLSGDGDNGIRVAVSSSGPVEPARLWQDARGQTYDGPLATYSGNLADWEETAAGCAYDPTDSPCGQSWKNFEPSTYMSAHDPAILLYQGTADTAIITPPTQDFGRRLTDANIMSATTLVPNVGHSLSASLDGGSRQSAMMDFITKRTSVNVAPSTSTVTSAASPLSPNVSQTTKVTVKVASANGTNGGWMTLAGDSFNSSVVLSSGTATFTVPKMTAGVHRFTAHYGGTVVSQPATTSFDLTVSGASTTADTR